MSEITRALGGINSIEELSERDIWINRINPISKLIVTFTYIILTISLEKTDIAGLVMMIPYLIILYLLGDISFFAAIKRMKIVLPFVVIIGIFNPMFDREVICTYCGIGITSGVFSFLTIIIKTLLTVFATYAFAVTTPVNKFCSSLRRIHVPAIIVTEILLIYRYISLMLKEVNRMSKAYKLRAPLQKGIAIGAWGSFIGNFLLRTMDRAGTVYESMHLRGYDDAKGLLDANAQSFRFIDFLYILGFSLLIFFCYENIFLLVINWWIL